MADNSLPVDEPKPFHPSDTPRGTLYYNLEELTEQQQKELNTLKINTIREDERYLAAHPEIRAIIVLLLRNLFGRRPILKIHEFIAKFFDRSDADIMDDVEKYLGTRKNHVYEDLEAVRIALSKKPVIEKEKSLEERPLDFVCGEECVCDHALQYKISEYPLHDADSFHETEHWMTPKSSRTSDTIESIQMYMTSDEQFTSTELAQIIDFVGADEGEETEADDTMGEGDSFTHDKEKNYKKTTAYKVEKEKFPRKRGSVSSVEGDRNETSSDNEALPNLKSVNMKSEDSLND